MEPLRYNSLSNTCADPICSNCVQYNNENQIPCIPVCVGDTVSDMIYKLGAQLCYNQSLTDLSKLNLSCIYTPCPSCQQPTSIVDVMQLMINTICTQNTTIANLQTQVNQLLAGI